MTGRAVAITVELRFCMKSAQATMSAVSRVRLEVGAGTRGARGASARPRGIDHRTATTGQ